MSEITRHSDYRQVLDIIKQRIQPTIGLILCKHKDKLDVEYALRDSYKPMGVSSFITKDIPLSVQSQLPTVEEIESELAQGYGDNQSND